MVSRARLVNRTIDRQIRTPTGIIVSTDSSNKSVKSKPSLQPLFTGPNEFWNEIAQSVFAEDIARRIVSNAQEESATQRCSNVMK